MNLHQHIAAEIERQYDQLRDAAVVMPSALAHRAFETFRSGSEDPHIQYASLEHLKQMAREFLRKRKNPDADESEAYQAQESLFGVSFSGKLQDRYPIPRQNGEEPAYKLRHLLSPEEAAWNVAMLRKSAGARLEHADALEAEFQVRQQSA